MCQAFDASSSPRSNDTLYSAPSLVSNFPHLAFSVCWKNSHPTPHSLDAVLHLHVNEEEPGCESGMFMLYRSCCSCFLLSLRAVPLHLDRLELTYSRRAPAVNLPFCP